MKSPPALLRAGVFAVSLLAFGALGFVAYRSLRPDEAPSVELVDRRDEFLANFEERRAEEPTEETAEAEPDVAAEAASTDDEATEEPAPAASGSTDPPPLVRDTLTRKQVEHFYPALRGEWVFEPDLWARRQPGLDKEVRFREHPDGSYRLRTNASGLRMDDDIVDGAPDLRVLVVGDSHTAGICNNDETFCAVLEELLAEALPGRSVEVVNGALGTYNFYNYLQVLEVFLELDPDVFVVVPYAGNDFHASAQITRFFRRMEAPALGPIEVTDIKHLRHGLVAQEMSQVVYFANNPKDVALAEETALAVTVELAELCRTNEIAFLGALLPTATMAQPELFGSKARVLRMVGLKNDDLKVSLRLGRRWLAFLEERGLPSLDLTPTLQGEEPLYWESDLHLNVDGHRRVAEALLPAVLALAAE